MKIKRVYHVTFWSASQGNITCSASTPEEAMRTAEMWKTALIRAGVKVGNPVSHPDDSIVVIK